eukprot:scaffold237_cov117-Isochrysis_galbana.AAC.6
MSPCQTAPIGSRVGRVVTSTCSPRHLMVQCPSGASRALERTYWSVVHGSMQWAYSRKMQEPSGPTFVIFSYKPFTLANSTGHPKICSIFGGSDRLLSSPSVRASRPPGEGAFTESIDESVSLSDCAEVLGARAHIKPGGSARRCRSAVSSYVSRCALSP